MSFTSRIRKYNSGYEKLQKKEENQNFIKSRQDALDKFVVKESQISSENETIFKKGYVKGGLVNEGYKDWSHIGTRLQEHEVGMEHEKDWATWYELQRYHWKNILVRIISIVKFLAKHSIAFRGTKERLYENNNENFLGLIEMLAEFDPVMQEHLISLIASSIKSEIIKKVRQVKYFSVILDCTPDVNHQEQIFMILRFVDLSFSSIVIEKSFLRFINVNDTTGQGLFDVLLQELKLLDFDVDNVRTSRSLKKLLDVNPRAFYTSCGSHSLNLMLCDMANTYSKARNFFGIIQRIYTIFANSTKSRVNSIKAIRFQIGEVRETLLQVSENDNNSKIKSEAKSLADNELGDFKFIVAIMIWYDVLSSVNVLLKSYLCSSMSQERLNGLALIAIENDHWEKVEYTDLVEDFVSKNIYKKIIVI
uniref:DUF4371 domain-containing protein n=1 Tax=Kalanchoe fedtschenkoi TaxID=63787 RepID=A0A7N0ZY98_KALFE